MDSQETAIRARELAIDRLNVLTTWIAACALAALGIFAVIAAETIPGKASSSESPSMTTASTGSSTSTSTSSFGHHHHRDSSTISASSGMPVVVTGGSH